MALASDVGNTQFVGATDPDSALIVKFYVKPVQNNFETSKQGKAVFEDHVYVQINVPGDKNNQWEMPARSDHKARFPRQWQHFLNSTQGDAREIGMPLTEWQLVTRSQAEELRAMKFFTVESIANASDQNVSQIGMIGGVAPHVLRDQARAFLAAAASTAQPQHQAAELAKANDRIKALEDQIAALATVQPAPVAAPVVAEAPAVPVKRGPGRPPKVAQGAPA